MQFTDSERGVVRYFLLNDNKPSYKKEMSNKTGINKNLCREVCDKFSSERGIKIFEKTYRIRRRGYLLHYFISSNFSAFLYIARNFLPAESSLFLESKYAQDMFARYGYIRLFRSLGVKKSGYFDFEHKDDYLKGILLDYSFLRKKLFTYVLLYPGNAAKISSSLSKLEKPPWRIPVILEEMHREKVLLKDRERYFVNPEFIRETIKDHPELYPFMNKRRGLSKLVQKIEEYLNLKYTKDGQKKN